MNKTAIEWTNYTSNPVRGYCPMECSYCYARRMYNRFGWDKTIRFVPEELAEWSKVKAGEKIFVGSTIELFHPSVPTEWLGFILKHTRLYPDVIFQFLTKRPADMIKYSFPSNVWCGATATDARTLNEACLALYGVKASVRFISLEPLLSWDPLFPSIQIPPYIGWIIIGALTPYSKVTFPKWEWIRTIIEACDKAGVPVFLKNNLGLTKFSEAGAIPYYKRHCSGTMELRQELPE